MSMSDLVLPSQLWHNQNPTRLDLIESHWLETINLLLNVLQLFGVGVLGFVLISWRILCTSCIWAWIACDTKFANEGELEPYTLMQLMRCLAKLVKPNSYNKGADFITQHFQWVDVLLDDEAKCMMCAQGTLEVTCSRSVAIVYIFLNS
jgi:hypothetical protein